MCVCVCALLALLLLTTHTSPKGWQSGAMRLAATPSPGGGLPMSLPPSKRALRQQQQQQQQQQQRRRTLTASVIGARRAAAARLFGFAAALLVLLLLLLTVVWMAFRAPAATGELVVVIDAGSTGTRARVFAASSTTAAGGVPQLVSVSSSDAALAGLGGDSGAEASAKAAAELRRLLERATASAERVMTQYPHSTVSGIIVLGTAGLRLLSASSRRRALDAARTACEEIVRNHPSIAGSYVHVGVLSGLEEAVLAWEAARTAAAARIAASSSSSSSSSAKSSRTARVGIVEVGGASVQVVIPSSEKEDELYVRSYLGYGAHEVEAALNAGLIREHAEARAGEDINQKDHSISTVESPCGFAGHSQEVAESTIQFTGDFDACVGRVMQQLDDIDADGVSGNVKNRAPQEEPLHAVPKSLLGRGTTLFGLALMYHVSHFITLSVGGLPDFPRASLVDLVDAGRHLCSVPWHEMEKHYRFVDDHTPPDRLGGRCFDVALMMSLLKRLGVGGQGVADTSAMNDVEVEFTERVDDMSVDWTVGVAINALRSRGSGGSGATNVSKLGLSGERGAVSTQLLLGKYSLVSTQ